MRKKKKKKAHLVAVANPRRVPLSSHHVNVMPRVPMATIGVDMVATIVDNAINSKNLALQQKAQRTLEAQVHALIMDKESAEKQLERFSIELTKALDRCASLESADTTISLKLKEEELQRLQEKYNGLRKEMPVIADRAAQAERLEAENHTMIMLLQNARSEIARDETNAKQAEVLSRQLESEREAKYAPGTHARAPRMRAHTRVLTQVRGANPHREAESEEQRAHDAGASRALTRIRTHDCVCARVWVCARVCVVCVRMCACVRLCAGRRPQQQVCSARQAARRAAGPHQVHAGTLQRSAPRCNPAHRVTTQHTTL